MAYDMIKTVLSAESNAKNEEIAARAQAQEMLAEAENTVLVLRQAQLEQAQNEAKLILSEAEQTAEGILKQAEKMTQMRRTKVIADTEKKYDEAISAILKAISE